MSRFANRAGTVRVDLGPCQCPGTPHESDWAEHRTGLGYGDFGAIALVAQGGDVFAAKRKTIEVAVVAWNLLGEDGEPAPLGEDSVFALDIETAEAIYASIDASVLTATQTLPNGSGARSRSSSRASASRTRK